MCGRFVQAEPADALASMFEVPQPGQIPPVSYNIAPTQQIAVVLESVKTGEPVRRLESARWSLVPKFAQSLESPYPTHNARSETVSEKPTFRDSLRTARALIPASGYYEWLTDSAGKTPYYIHPRESDAVIAFAALYSWWRNPAKPDTDPERWVLSATILTAPATGALTELHERMPVMVAPTWWDTWLDASEPGDDEVVRAIVSASDELVPGLRWHPVASLRGNGPELVTPRT